MAEENQKYQGGIAKPAGSRGKNEGTYLNFVAYELEVTPQITLVNVHGQVRVGNPGIEAQLTKILDENPNILLLRLDLKQRSGAWPQVEVLAPAVYAAPQIGDGPFERCQIINGEVTVVDIPFTR